MNAPPGASVLTAWSAPTIRSPRTSGASHQRRGSDAYRRRLRTRPGAGVTGGGRSSTAAVLNVSARRAACQRALRARRSPTTSASSPVR